MRVMEGNSMLAHDRTSTTIVFIKKKHGLGLFFMSLVKKEYGPSSKENTGPVQSLNMTLVEKRTTFFEHDLFCELVATLIFSSF